MFGLNCIIPVSPRQQEETAPVLPPKPVHHLPVPPPHPAPAMTRGKLGRQMTPMPGSFKV